MPTNTPPVFTGAIQRFLVEDQFVTQATGFLLANASDPDPGDALEVVTVAGLATGPALGEYGQLEWNTLTGAFTYLLNNSLASVNRLGANQTGVDRFSLVIKDSSGATATSEVVVTIIGVNDVPVATPQRYFIAEAGPAGTMAGNLLSTVADPDIGDVLRIVGVQGTAAPEVAGRFGTLSWNATTGDFSYATDARAQRLGQDDSATERFTYTVSDGNGGFATTTLTFEIDGLNTAPTTRPTTREIDADATTPLFGDLAGVVRDVDRGDTVLITSVTGGNAFGNIQIVAATGYRYNVDPFLAAHLREGAIGREVITYMVSDSFGATAQGTLTIRVVGVNDAPTAGAVTRRIDADAIAPLIGDVRGAIRDVDRGDTHNIIAFEGPLNYGSLTGTSGTGFRYAVDPLRAASLKAGEVGVEVVTYTIADSQGATAQGTLTIRVVGVNDAPTLRPPAIVPPPLLEDAADSEDRAATFDIRDFAFDPDGDALQLLAVEGETAPGVIETEYGWLVWSRAGQLNYLLDDTRPATDALTAGQRVVDQVALRIGDGRGGITETTLDVAIIGANDRPVLGGNNIATLREDGPVGTASGVVTIADPDAGESALVLTGMVANYGMFSFNPTTGAWSYELDDARAQPLAAGRTVQELLLLESRDGTAGLPILVVVEGSNDDPLAGPVQTFTLTEDGVGPGLGRADMLLLAGATDPDGDLLSVIGVQGSAVPGVARGTFGNMSWSEGPFGSGIYVLDNASTATQALKQGETGIDSFYVTIADGQGGIATGIVRIQVAGLNDTAQILGGSTGVVVDKLIAHASGQLLVEDPDAGESIFAAPPAGAFAGTYGDFAFDPVTGHWSYALTPGKPGLVALGAGQIGTDTLGVTSRDGTASRAITVQVVGADDLPVARDDAYAARAGRTLVTGGQDGLLANDTAGDGGTALIGWTNPAHGTLALAPDGSFAYTPQRDFLGRDSFTYTMSDADGDRATATVTIDVNAPPGFDLVAAIDAGGGFRIDLPDSGLSKRLEAAGLGDLNGDGLPDLAIGATDTIGGAEVFIVFGQAGNDTIDAASLAADGTGLRIAGLVGATPADAGDVDGDGRADLLIGDVTEAYLLHGPPGGADIPLGAGAAVPGFLISGIRMFGALGTPVAGLGDVNGDGLDDLLVGAPAVSPGGAAHVVFGKADRAEVDLASLGSAGDGFRVSGSAHGSAGYSVAALGDVNGDGLADMLIGAPDTAIGGRQGAGAVHVVFGKADGAEVDLATLGVEGNGYRILGANAGDGAGTQVVGLGDINGDGRGDMAILVPGNDLGGRDSGAVHIVLGQSGGADIDLATFAAQGQGYSIIGLGAPDSAPQRGLAVLDDLNGDGLAELLVTENNLVHLLFGRSGTGHLRLTDVVDGVGGLAIATPFMAGTISVDGVADMNGDGLPEILLAGTIDDPAGMSQSAYVLFGQAAWATDPLVP